MAPNISETIKPIDSKFVHRAGTHSYTSWGSNITHTKSSMAAGCHLEKSIDVITLCIDQFGWHLVRWCKKTMPMMMNRRKLKPFSETAICGLRYLNDIWCAEIWTSLNEWTFCTWICQCLLCRVPTHPWKYLKVLEFFSPKFKALKVLENRTGAWKSLNFIQQVLESPWIHHVILCDIINFVNRCFA